MVYVIIKFKNGAHGIVIAGILAPRSDNDLVLYGSKAKITCKGTLGRSAQGGQGELLVDGDSVNVRMGFPANNPSTLRMILTIKAFNKWIEDDTEPYISGQNGLQMVKISNAILESSHQGKAVEIKGR
jgi:predicted dehydrogenase